VALKSRIELDNAVVLSQAIGLTSPMVARVTRQVLNRAEVLAPVRFGVLRGSHSMSMRVSRATVTGRVEVAARYAEFVHNGTEPHNIRPKGAKALSFTWTAKGGVRVVVPKKGLGRGPTGIRKTKRGVVLYIAKGFVRHPGTKGRPWLFRALREVATLEDFSVIRTFGVGTRPDS
jgi:hypothetical protein